MNIFNKLFSNTPKIKHYTQPNAHVIFDDKPFYYKFHNKDIYAKLYNSIPDLKAVIDYMSKCFGRGVYKLYLTDKNGGIIKEITSHKLLDLLSQPNYFDTDKDFKEIYFKNKKIFGNAYIYMPTPAGFTPSIDNVKTLINLFPQTTTPQINYNANLQTINELVYYFQYQYQSINYNISPEFIIHYKEQNIDINTDNIAEGKSPIDVLNYPLSNIEKAFEAQNVLLHRRGALGILSNNSKDTVGTIPIAPDEISRIQQEYRRYGLLESQNQIIISNSSLTWQQMSLPISELQLPQTIENNASAICNVYGFPKLLLSYPDGATFANKASAEKELYQNVIIPEGNLYVTQLNKKLNLKDNNLKLEISFEHVECLQEDKLQEANKDKLTIDSIISVQNAVSSGIMNYENGLNILIQILNFSENNAKLILSNNKITNGNTAQI